MKISGEVEPSISLTGSIWCVRERDGKGDRDKKPTITHFTAIQVTYIHVYIPTYRLVVVLVVDTNFSRVRQVLTAGLTCFLAEDEKRLIPVEVGTERLLRLACRSHTDICVPTARTWTEERERWR